MTFISILCALVIEQFRPLRVENTVNVALTAFAEQVEGWFNDGQKENGRLAWLVMMLCLLVPTIIVTWLVAKLGPLAELLWSVLVLYLTLGFRHYSHYFTSIQLALNAGDHDTARVLLAEWTKQDTVAMEVSEISRIAVEQALVTSHRHVFGVFFWFAIPVLGPIGAVLYRTAEYLARSWNGASHPESDNFGRFATQAYYWIDWLPARLTATAFAIVGNFEDAIYGWRHFAHRWQNETTGIILSSGGGAMGVRLGTPVEHASMPAATDETAIEPAAEPETPPGEEANVRSLQSTVGLVWRALLLWMLLLLLLSAAIWLG